MSSIPVTPRPTAAPGVRRISEADINWALSEGWKDFNAKRGDVLVLAVLYPVLGLLAAVMALRVAGRRLARGDAVPFGPFLCAAGWLVFLRLAALGEGAP